MVTLDLPTDFVEDTNEASVKVIGDLMGPALDDIESLLKMPYGCGEQNMLNFAPNIFIMQYLKSVDAVTTEIQTKSSKYLLQGSLHTHSSLEKCLAVVDRIVSML